MTWIYKAMLFLGLVLLCKPIQALESSPPEHFVRGEVRLGLSWDNISAMYDGVYRFGGAAGVFVRNGLEVGYEQQFIVPNPGETESRSWASLRLMPFRDWLISPFVAARVGYYILPEQDAVALGGGGGFLLFVDDHFAFEASVYSQAVFSKLHSAQKQLDADWRVVIFFQ